MSTELPNGVVIVDGDDAGSTLGLAYGSSVDNLIGGFTETRQIQTFIWPNAAARNDQAGMVPGDQGYQIDTGVAYTYNGSNWAFSVPSGVIDSGNISSQSSLVIDGLTGFREYEITLDLPTSSTANQMTAQLRSGGVTNTSANYDTQRAGATTTTPVATEALGIVSWTLGNGNRVEHTHILRLISLNSASRTVLENRFTAWDASSNGQSFIVAHRHRSATAFDGIEFTTSSGTVTGTYVVRGIE